MHTNMVESLGSSSDSDFAVLFDDDTDLDQVLQSLTPAESSTLQDVLTPVGCFDEEHPTPTSAPLGGDSSFSPNSVQTCTPEPSNSQTKLASSSLDKHAETVKSHGIATIADTPAHQDAVYPHSHLASPAPTLEASMPQPAPAVETNNPTATSEHALSKIPVYMSNDDEASDNSYEGGASNLQFAGNLGLMPQCDELPGVNPDGFDSSSLQLDIEGNITAQHGYPHPPSSQYLDDTNLPPQHVGNLQDMAPHLGGIPSPNQFSQFGNQAHFLSQEPLESSFASPDPNACAGAPAGDLEQPRRALMPVTVNGLNQRLAGKRHGGEPDKGPNDSTQFAAQEGRKRLREDDTVEFQVDNKRLRNNASNAVPLSTVAVPTMPNHPSMAPMGMPPLNMGPPNMGLLNNFPPSMGHQQIGPGMNGFSMPPPTMPPPTMPQLTMPWTNTAPLSVAPGFVAAPTAALNTNVQNQTAPGTGTQTHLTNNHPVVKMAGDAYQLRAPGTLGYVDPPSVEDQIERNRQQERRGVQYYAWHPSRIARYEAQNLAVPFWAYDGEHHAIETGSAAPANTCWDPLHNVEISVQELLAFAPKCLAQHGVLQRLVGNGWGATDIANAISFIHGKDVDECVKADTVKHMIIASDKARYGRKWSAVVQEHRRANPTGPLPTRAPTTDFTPSRWLEFGAGFKPHDKFGLEDVTLFDMGTSVPNAGFPRGEGAGLLTKAIQHALLIGDMTTCLSDFDHFVQEHGLIAAPMAPDSDQKYLQVVKDRVRANRRATRATRTTGS